MKHRVDGIYRDKRKPLLRERRLFGEHTCKINGCGADATCRVANPAWTLGEPPRYEETAIWVDIWYCPHHANRCLDTGSAFS